MGVSENKTSCHGLSIVGSVLQEHLRTMHPLVQTLHVDNIGAYVNNYQYYFGGSLLYLQYNKGTQNPIPFI